MSEAWYVFLSLLLVSLYVFHRDATRVHMRPKPVYRFKYDQCDIHNSNWLGDTLVYSEKTCDVSAIRYDPCPHKVVLLGDSLSRRFGYTWQALADGKTSVSELGSDIVSHSQVVLGDCLRFVWAPTFKDVNNKLPTIKEEKIIVSVGIHDLTFDMDGMDQLIDTASSDPRIWFRTEPESDSGIEKVQLERNISSYMIHNWPNHRIIDHQRLMRPRSQGENRIRGNTREHLGTAARVILVQSLLLRTP